VSLNGVVEGGLDDLKSHFGKGGENKGTGKKGEERARGKESILEISSSRGRNSQAKGGGGGGGIGTEIKRKSRRGGSRKGDV